MAKLHRGRFSPVLSTYTALECWLHLSPFLHRHPYKLSYPVLIKNRKRVLLEDTFIDIHWQEFSHVIAAIAKGELREKIGRASCRVRAHVTGVRVAMRYA